MTEALGIANIRSVAGRCGHSAGGEVEEYLPFGSSNGKIFVVTSLTRKGIRLEMQARVSRKPLSADDLAKVQEVEALIRDWFEHEAESELDLLTNVDGMTSDIWTEVVLRACRAGWAVALRPGMVIIRDPDAIDA